MFPSAKDDSLLVFSTLLKILRVVVCEAVSVYLHFCNFWFLRPNRPPRLYCCLSLHLYFSLWQMLSFDLPLPNQRSPSRTITGGSRLQYHLYTKPSLLILLLALQYLSQCLAYIAHRQSSSTVRTLPACC